MPKSDMSLEQLDRHLASHSYLGSSTSVTLVDYRECQRLSWSTIDTERFPHLSRWHSHVTLLMRRYAMYDRYGDQLAEGEMPVLAGATHNIALGDELEVLAGAKSPIAFGKECYRRGDLGRVSKIYEVGESQWRFDIIWYRTLATTTSSCATWGESFKFVTKAREPVVGDELRVLPGGGESNNYKAGDIGIVSAVFGHTLMITWYSTGRGTSCAKDTHVENFIMVGRVLDTMPSGIGERLVGSWHAGRPIPCQFPSRELQLDMDFHVFLASDGSLKIRGTYLARDVGGAWVKEQWCSSLLARTDGELIAIGSPVRLLLKTSCVHTGTRFFVGNKSYHLYQQSLCPGQFVRLECSEQFVKKALSPFTQIWWSEDLRGLLGSVGKVLHIDGRDGTAEVGQWLSREEATCIGATTIGSSLNRARWLPSDVLRSISAEDYAMHRSSSETTHLKTQQTYLPTPLRLPVCNISGYAVASVSISSLDSKVIELKQDVAQQIGLCHHSLELIIEGSSSPMVPSASLRMYGDSLENSKQLCLIIKEDEAHAFRKGSRVAPREELSFHAGDKDILLEAGLKGSVLEVNDDGDILVQFNNKSSTEKEIQTWVTRNNTWKLRNLIAEPPQGGGLKRIRKELMSMCDTMSGNPELFGMPLTVSADYSILEASFPGPECSPYEGGIFLLRIRMGRDYPFDPPSMRFITKIFHCNIDQTTGHISLDLLQEQWSPAMTIQKVVLAIQSLLADPNPEDPVESEIALMYMNDREQHDATVREWVRCYAQ